ncbi:MAG: hypothetical protein NTW87_21290, partial [Planctomycetota bacterium]|nr:hypothetical protein [Planctomycetota bacterium]
MMDSTSAAGAGNGGTLWYCVKCTRLITPPGSTGFITPGGEHLCSKCAPVPQAEPVAVVPPPPAQRRSSRSVIRLPQPAPAATGQPDSAGLVELSPVLPVAPAPGPKKLPLPLVLAGGFCGIGALLFIVALVFRGGPAENDGVAATTGQTPKPAPEQKKDAAPEPKKDAADENVNRVPEPAQREATPPKTPPSQPTKPEVRTDTAPKPPPPTPKPQSSDDGLKAFKDGLQNAAKLGDSEKYSAALDLLNSLKAKYAQAPWWQTQSSEWSAAEQRVQQFVTELGNEAQVAREQAEKSDKLDFLDKTEAAWRIKFNAFAADKLAAGPAVEVLKAVLKAKAKLAAQQREKKAAEIAGKLDTIEKQLKSRPQNLDPLARQLDEMDKQLLQDVELAEKLGERWAGANYDAAALKDYELGVYKTKVKAVGGGAEVAYDFSGADELQAWTLDDPAKQGGGDFDEKRKAVLVKTMGGHNWDGKDRRGTPVFKLPFYFRPETWVVEATVELASDANKGAKP